MSIGGSKCFVLITDEVTGYRWINTNNRKSSFSDYLEKVINFLEFNGYHIEFIRLDQGGEFTTKSLSALCVTKGITLEFTAIDQHSSSGISESSNPTDAEEDNS